MPIPLVFGIKQNVENLVVEEGVNHFLTLINSVSGELREVLYSELFVFFERRVNELGKLLYKLLGAVDGLTLKQNYGPFSRLLKHILSILRLYCVSHFLASSYIESYAGFKLVLRLLTFVDDVL